MKGADFGDLFLSGGRLDHSEKGDLANIIDFVEEPWGLGRTGLRLFPVQRVILKAHYGIPLDTTGKRVPVWGKDWREGWRREDERYLTEADYLKYLYDTGRCNTREVVEGHQRREMILSVGRRSGKCLLGDSLVLTDKGVMRIDALGRADGPEVQPLDIGVVQEQGVRARSRYFYNGGARRTRTLTTRCGYTLGGTSNHRIKVMTDQGVVDWRYLEDLRVGDQVCVHRTTDMWASTYVDTTPYHNTRGNRELVFPNVLDEDWGLLLGYLVGDGLWGYPSRVEVTVEHSETWDALTTLFTKLFGSYTIVMDKRTANTGCVKFSSVGMRQFLHNLGFRLDASSDTKSVPWSILQSPRSVVCAFLRGLFEADGGVESGGKTVSFSTASEQLAREVQTLLLNLGIVSRLRSKSVQGKTYWLLAIRGLRSRAAFAESVGFDSNKKMQPLLRSLRSASREGGDTESIPHQRQWVRRLLESVPKRASGQGRGRSKLRSVLGNTIKPSATDQLTYARMASACSVAQELGADEEVLEHFRHLESLDYFYDPVVQIEEGEHKVFDLTVPDGQMFVANGLTNHNTFLSSCIAAYETYKLLKKGHPQRYYGLPDGNVIQLISVATGKDQANILFREVASHFSKCDFFRPFTANNTMSHVNFQTPFDIDKFGPYKEHQNPSSATVRVTFASCVAKSLRGSGNIVIILDEFAHFSDGSQSSAKAVYDAVTPSLSAFSAKRPDDPSTPIDPNAPSEGRTILISSPLGRQGHFYKMFQIGMSGGEASDNMLCIQAPTWEVNPTLPPGEFAKQYAKDVAVFFTEYGGEFSDRTRGWIENAADLEACIDPALEVRRKAPPRMPHFAGVDLGLSGDGTAIAIGHVDGQGRIVVDLVDQIKAGEGDFVGQERLEFDDVADWVRDYAKKFFIVEGMFDSWAGIPFEQALAKRGLGQFKSVHHTRNLTSEIYKNFKDMMIDKRLALYNKPREDGEDYAPYIQELLELQATHHSKYVTLVEAPQVAGKHDDRSDALVRMVYLASKHMGAIPQFGRPLRRGPGATTHHRAAASASISARRKALAGGTHESRQVRGRTGMRLPSGILLKKK